MSGTDDTPRPCVLVHDLFAPGHGRLTWCGRSVGLNPGGEPDACHALTAIRERMQPPPCAACVAAIVALLLRAPDVAATIAPLTRDEAAVLRVLAQQPGGSVMSGAGHPFVCPQRIAQSLRARGFVETDVAEERWTATPPFTLLITDAGRAALGGR